MGRAAALLRARGRTGEHWPRAAAATALVAALSAYAVLAPRLPAVGTWWDVALVALVLMPATTAVAWLALPLWSWRLLGTVAVGLALLVAVCVAADWDVAANGAKLLAVTAAGFWFLALFERVSWVVIVALLVPLVDAISVWRGPTRFIVSERPDVFGALSVAFPVPGGGAFQLGLPDLLFLAVFLAAAVRWSLRECGSWLAMTASFGATMALAVWLDPFGLGGLPALPLLSAAFLAANADVLVARLRGDTPERVLVPLRAADPEAAARFYRKGIGARAGAGGPERRRVEVAASWWLDGGPRTELGFHVDDVAAAHARAVEAGGRALHAPRDEPWGRTARLLDPDGNVVVLRRADRPS